MIYVEVLEDTIWFDKGNILKVEVYNDLDEDHYRVLMVLVGEVKATVVKDKQSLVEISATTEINIEQHPEYLL